jgi:BirA family biotin operon repressor/biotin-[acetyl-CoA-carboxylase] ligase
MNDMLDKTAILGALKTNWIGHRLHVYQTVSSTNTLLKEMAANGEPTGTMVIADHQSTGRGRQGKYWRAPAGSSLLFSLLFRPGWPATQAQWLMMIAGLAVAESLRADTELNVHLKWPNDIVLGDNLPWRKCGGLLLETEFEGSVLVRAILGIGINVNIPPADLSELPENATSLQVETGGAIRRLPLLADIILRLESLYNTASQGHSPLTRWKALLVDFGYPVRAQVTGADRAIEGIAIDTDSWGRMLIRDSEGNIHTFAAGEVSLSY